MVFLIKNTHLESYQIIDGMLQTTVNNIHIRFDQVHVKYVLHVLILFAVINKTY